MLVLLFLKLKLQLLLSNLFLKMPDTHLVLLEFGDVRWHLHLIYLLARRVELVRVMSALVLHSVLTEHAIRVNAHLHACARVGLWAVILQLVLSPQLNSSRKLMTLHHHVLILQVRLRCRKGTSLHWISSLLLWSHQKHASLTCIRATSWKMS